MAKFGPGAILIPLTLLNAASGDKLYTSKAFDAIGTDAVNDVFRVYAEKVHHLDAPKIPPLDREFVFPDVEGKKIKIKAEQGTMLGTIKLAQNKTAHMAFDPIQNIIYATFQITFHDMKVAFKSFGVQFDHLSDSGSVIIAPKTSDFELTLAVQHIDKPARRCFSTLKSTKTIDMKDFKTTSFGFGSPDINRDIGKIINQLMQEEVLGKYMDEALKAYAEQTAPHVFIYCKYINPS